MAEMYQEAGRVTNLAPTPTFPERDRGAVNYEAKMAANTDRRGFLSERFEEGLATDTDVPNDFQLGVMQGYRTAPGRPNHNMNVFEKWPEETMKQRAHVGSAAWIDSVSMLGDFTHGVNVDANASRRFEEVRRSGGRYERLHGAIVSE
jgi:hypothetical protein